MPDNARIDQLMGGIAARAGNIARVPHFITRFKTANACTHGFHNAAGVPAENAWFRQAASDDARVNFGIDRVDGNGFTSTSRSYSPGCGIGWVISMKSAGLSGLTAMALTDMVSSFRESVLLRLVY